MTSTLQHLVNPHGMGQSRGHAILLPNRLLHPFSFSTAGSMQSLRNYRLARCDNRANVPPINPYHLHVSIPVRQLLALFICLLASYTMHGQTFTDDLREIDSNGGSLEVVQSTDMDTIVNEKELGKAAPTADGLANRSKRPKLKPGQTPTERVSGFRIQIYAGTGSEGNANAKKMQARARQAFPGLSAYVSLNGPRWVCRLGDFQTNQEAQAFLRRVRSSGISKTVSIVRSAIFVAY